MTIDAAGRQVENARLIRERGGHDPLAVRANPPSLRGAVEAVVADACARDFVGVAADGGRRRWPGTAGRRRDT